MSGKDNIEELFKDAFEHFESDVSPGLWDKVSSQIQSPSTGVSDGGSSASTAAAGGAGIAKIAAVIGVTTSLIAGGFWLASDSDDQPEVVSTDMVEVYEEPVASTLPATENAEYIANDKQAPEEVITSNTTGTSIAKTAENNSNSNQPINKGTIATPQMTEPIVTEPTTKSNNEEVASTKKTESATMMVSSPKPIEEISEEGDNKVKIRKNPEASIHASVRKGSIPLEIQFSNLDRKATNMSWNFGDGSAMTSEEAPFHVFTKAGTYAVILTVRGDNDWISRDTMMINAKEELAVFIPNIITPNSDGINDVFKVEVEQGGEITFFECMIMDRNGKEVFRANSHYSFWNGQDLNNNDCPQASYYYVVKIATENNPPEIMKGTVQIMR